MKVESILLTIWGLSKLIMAIYTKTEYFLYDKDFEEAYKETEERVNSILMAQPV